MAETRPDDVPDLRPGPSPWRYAAYPVLGWVALMLVGRLLFALIGDEAPYAWAAIIVLGFAIALAIKPVKDASKSAP